MSDNQQREFNLLITRCLRWLNNSLHEQSVRLTDIEGSLRGTRASLALLERSVGRLETIERAMEAQGSSGATRRVAPSGMRA